MARAARGFTIVELMIAMTLGLVLAGAIVSIFLGTRQSFERDEKVMRMQDDARQAVRQLHKDIGMAGFWADLLLPTSISTDASLAVTVDCGPAGAANWIYQPVTPGTSESQALTSVDNATGATANGSYSCIDSTELEPGTDVIAIKRLVGSEAAAITNDTVYVRTNGTLGLLYREPEATPPAVSIAAPFTEWEYRPRIYYVRNYADAAGDGVPTLCRKVLEFGGTPTMNTECLARGIEDLQVEFGLDSDGDGEPNVYLAAPTLAQMQSAVAARIFVLARSAEEDAHYTNEKTYSISNAPDYTPADGYYRRVFSIHVGLSNLRSLRMLRST